MTTNTSSILKIGLSALVLFSACKKTSENFNYVQFNTSSTSISEAAVGDVNIPVQLATPQIASPITITYTVAGSALQGTHYSIISSGSITIPANTSTADIKFKTVNNLLQDGNKTVILTITKAEANGVALKLGTLNLKNIITIIDDECSPYLPGVWTYKAKYFSYFGVTEIPANQAGQGLAVDQNPIFTGTVTITDPTNTRAYILSDGMVGQFAAFGVATKSPLLDACGTLTFSSTTPPLFFGFYPIQITSGKIISADSININWSAYLDASFASPVFRGEAGLKKQ